jgi:hypothetical protein
VKIKKNLKNVVNAILIILPLQNISTNIEIGMMGLILGAKSVRKNIIKHIIK